MSKTSEDELRRQYAEAQQKVESIKSNWISEQVQDRKFNHHSS